MNLTESPTRPSRNWLVRPLTEAERTQVVTSLLICHRDAIELGMGGDPASHACWKRLRNRLSALNALLTDGERPSEIDAGSFVPHPREV